METIFQIKTNRQNPQFAQDQKLQKEFQLVGRREVEGVQNQQRTFCKLPPPDHSRDSNKTIYLEGNVTSILNALRLESDENMLRMCHIF